MLNLIETRLVVFKMLTLLFFETIYNFFNESVPMRVVHKLTFPPWYTPLIRKDVKVKQYFHRMLKRFPHSTFYREKFQYLRAKIKRNIKESYASFISATENSLKDDPKFFWTFINSKRNNSI